MTLVTEIKVHANNEVWCRVELNRNTDVLGTFQLYKPYEIEAIKREAVKAYLDYQYQSYIERPEAQ